MSFVDIFPAEISMRIFSFVDPQDITKHAQYVCKSWHRFFNDAHADETFWAPLYSATFDRPSELVKLLEDEQILLSGQGANSSSAGGEGRERAPVPIWHTWCTSLYIRLFVEESFCGAAAAAPRHQKKKWAAYNRLGERISSELSERDSNKRLCKRLQEHVRTELSAVEASNVLFCVSVESFISARCCDPTQIRTLDDFSYGYFSYAHVRMEEKQTPTGVLSVTNLMLHGARVAKKIGMRVNGSSISGLLSGVKMYCDYVTTRKVNVNAEVLRTTLEMFDVYDRVTQTTEESALTFAADVADVYCGTCSNWDASEHWFSRAVNLYQRLSDGPGKTNMIAFLHHMHSFRRTGKTAKQHLLAALDGYTNLLPAPFSESPVTLGNIADVYTELLHITGDDGEAKGYFEQSAEYFRRSVRANAGECVYNNFGWLYLEASRRSFGAGLTEMAIKAFKKSLDYNPDYFNAKSNMSLAIIERARQTRTVEPLLEARDIIQGVLDSNPTDYKSESFMGIAYMEMFRIKHVITSIATTTASTADMPQKEKEKEKEVSPGLLDKALKHCMASLSENKGNLMCVFTIAFVAALKGDMRLCEQYVRRFNRLSGGTERSGDIVLKTQMILENLYNIEFHAHSFSWIAAKKYAQQEANN